MNCHIKQTNSLPPDLSEIRYHFTPCGSTVHDGPTFDQCETYYREILSPIATDRALFQFDEEDFRGGQGFRIPREDVYNVTIAGAAGGRGLCNIHSGLGRTLQFQVRLTPDYELLVMVGQKGKSPCENFPGHSLCQTPPINETNAAQCNQSWYELISDNETDDLIYRLTGGGGGGGASMLRARNVERGGLLTEPIAVAGGGGGSSAILDYIAAAELIRMETSEPSENVPPEQLYQYHLNARLSSYTDVHQGFNFTRGYRPSLQLSVVSGAGGGWHQILTSSDTDGKSISQSRGFAEAGFDCGRLFGNSETFKEVDGGFGGGGGECGGGGGGGGYTGGAVLQIDNYVPGGGGHSVLFSSQDIPILGSLRPFFNDGDGFVNIVPANCNCTGTCAVNEADDTFECLCPNNTNLALDRFDCYHGK